MLRHCHDTFEIFFFVSLACYPFLKCFTGFERPSKHYNTIAPGKRQRTLSTLKQNNSTPHLFNSFARQPFVGSFTINSLILLHQVLQSVIVRLSALRLTTRLEESEWGVCHHSFPTLLDGAEKQEGCDDWWIGGLSLGSQVRSLYPVTSLIHPSFFRGSRVGIV